MISDLTFLLIINIPFFILVFIHLIAFFNAKRLRKKERERLKQIFNKIAKLNKFNKISELKLYRNGIFIDENYIYFRIYKLKHYNNEFCLLSLTK
ncbi:hypothetical protein CEP45_07465 [Mergibacter septicus]|nr:hypothetical protein CEP45_07465 [Mergibacter septicus]